MRFFHKLAAIAIPAVCLGLSSCGNSFEQMENQMAGVYRDLAEQMLECETADDVIKLLAVIDEATAAINAKTSDLKTNKADLVQERKDMTLRQIKELKKNNEVAKAQALLTDGITHISEISGANMKDIYEAKSKFDKAVSEYNQAAAEILMEAAK